MRNSSTCWILTVSYGSFFLAALTYVFLGYFYIVPYPLWFLGVLVLTLMAPILLSLFKKDLIKSSVYMFINLPVIFVMLGSWGLVTCQHPTVIGEYLSPDKSNKLVVYQQSCGFGDNEFSIIKWPMGLGIPSKIAACEDCSPKFDKWLDSKNFVIYAHAKSCILNMDAKSQQMGY